MLSASLEFFKMFLKNLLVFNFSIKCFFQIAPVTNKEMQCFCFFFWGGRGGEGGEGGWGGGKFTFQPTI